MFNTVTQCTTTSKESACRIIYMLCQQTSPKRWFAKVNMTLYYDVTKSVYLTAMTTIHLCQISYEARASGPLQSRGPQRESWHSIQS